MPNRRGSNGVRAARRKDCGQRLADLIEQGGAFIVDPRQSGAFSSDIVLEYEPVKDMADVSAYGYSLGAEVLALGVDTGAGNSYFPLGGGLDYLYLVGVSTAQMSGEDFLA